MPLFKRIFGQGKNKASNKFVALCIGDYSLLISTIEGKDAHQLQALLAHDAPGDEGSPSTSQANQTYTKNSLIGSQTSFRGFRHLLQHWGGGSTAAAASQDGTEVEAQQQLASFLKNLGGYPEASFVPPAEDGLVPRDKVLAKLTKLFKHSTAPVIFVSYCGPSDERGNWRLASQIPAGSGGSGGGGGALHAGSAGNGGVGGAGTTVLSFREVSMLWQRYRKHSQRLVLLLDCANSGYWVSALRMLSKAEQLELSLGVQASDCSLPATQAMQLTYQPGIFTQFYLTNNKWRRADPRRNTASASNQQQQQQQQEGADAAAAAASTYANVSSSGQRGEQWLPGMLPSYYATWLNDNLVDYGIALRFFNTQVHSQGPGSGDGNAASATPGRPGGEAAGRNRESLDPLSPLAVHQRAWRANTGPLAAIDSSKSFGRASRGADEVTSPSSDPWGSPRTANGVVAGGGRGEGGAGEHGDHRSLAATLAVRAVSMQDSARRRFSSLYYDNCTTDGAGATGNQPIVGSPTAPSIQRVRLSTPQAEWRVHGDLRSPLGPADESLYKMGQDTDASGSTLPQLPSQVVGIAASAVASPSASGYGDLNGAFASGGGRLHGRSSGVIDASGSVGGAGGHSHGVSKLAQSPPPPSSSTSPPRGVGGVAVHPDEVDVREDAISAVVAPNADEILVVQHSAQSDSVAITWDRRSTHAERCLVDERQNGGTSSFTNPSGQPNGFANDLYGALHVVATDRRLRARRAPLEGDESMDTMMEDADLERRASVASLPSVMLPRELGGGGGGGGRMGSSGLIAGLGMPSGVIAGAAPPPSSAVHGGTGGGGGTAASTASGGPALPTPRTSALLAMAAVDSAGGDDRLSAMHQRRQVSRLFLMSMADRTTSGGRVSAGQMEELAEAEGGGGGGNEMDELSMTASYDAATEDEQRSQTGDSAPCTAAAVLAVAAAGKDEQGRSTGTAAGQRQWKHSTGAVAVAAAASAFGVGCAASAAAAGGRPPMAPTSMDWPQPAESPAPSLLTEASEGTDPARIATPGRGSNLPSGVSGSALWNLLRQNVAIADSMDLDSIGAGMPPMWQRRPGRFEMAGSESSSFVFGDDQERFNLLRQLRGGQGEEPREPSPCDPHHEPNHGPGPQPPQPQLQPQVGPSDPSVELQGRQGQGQREVTPDAEAQRLQGGSGGGGGGGVGAEEDSQSVADGWLAPAGSSDAATFQADMLLSLNSGDVSMGRQASRG